MGGVSPGMNDALRACVLKGVSEGHKVKEEREGRREMMFFELSPPHYRCLGFAMVLTVLSLEI